jgi:hypothetical protein
MTVELPGVPPEVNVADVVTQMIRRAASSSFEDWWSKVEEAGFCANPIHLTGGDGLGREHHVFTRCNNRRAIVCPHAQISTPATPGNSSTPAYTVGITTYPQRWPSTPRRS